MIQRVLAESGDPISRARDLKKPLHSDSLGLDQASSPLLLHIASSTREHSLHQTTHAHHRGQRSVTDRFSGSVSGFVPPVAPVSAVLHSYAFGYARESEFCVGSVR
jgi:hypothetical protein